MQEPSLNKKKCGKSKRRESKLADLLERNRCRLDEAAKQLRQVRAGLGILCGTLGNCFIGIVNRFGDSTEVRQASEELNVSNDCGQENHRGKMKLEAEKSQPSVKEGAAHRSGEQGKSFAAVERIEECGLPRPDLHSSRSNFGGVIKQPRGPRSVRRFRLIRGGRRALTHDDVF